MVNVKKVFDFYCCQRLCKKAFGFKFILSFIRIKVTKYFAPSELTESKDFVVLKYHTPPAREQNPKCFFSFC